MCKYRFRGTTHIAIETSLLLFIAIHKRSHAKYLTKKNQIDVKIEFLCGKVTRHDRRASVIHPHTKCNTRGN